MKYTPVLLSLLILAAASTLSAQSPSTSAAAKPAAKLTAAQIAQNQAATKKAFKKDKKAEVHLRPFSSIAFGGGMSLMGVNLQASTNLNRYLNLRGTGNFFNYTASNLSTNGFDLNGKVNMATAGVSLDYFPFPNHGLRISPGMLFYNQNGITATATLTPGNSITLNNTNYYPEVANPPTVYANLGMNTNKEAFTITTGWGNVIPRRHQDQVFSHLTFPFEIGAAFTGTPTIGMTFNPKSYACDTAADAITGVNCVDLSSDLTAQSNLNAQLAKWRNDLNPYKVYPIFSLGISYSFNLKPQQ